MGSAHWSRGRTPGFQPCRGDQSLITMATAEDRQKKSETNDQLREYISQWRDERAKEEAELKRLKDKQAARKEIRAEQEKKQAAQKRAEEERIKKEEQEKKEAEAQAKKKRMEEDERKRQEMLAAQKEGGKKSSGPAMDARKEMSKSKEQVEEEMKISLSIRIKPLALDEMDSDELKNKANQIWNTIVALETDKYDYEQRQLDQDYEFKELAERQKLQLRNKAIKKGLDPESFTQKHPPTIHMFSKYERRTDTRTYGDRKKLYEGGAEVIRAEWLESMWNKNTEWTKRAKTRLPKWFGERPGKKAGDPETPEGEEGGAEAEAEEEEYDEEEEEYDEEEEE